MRTWWPALVLAAGCAPSPPADLPEYQGEGERLVGRSWNPRGLAWLDAAPSGRVTLVRWWTDRCELCSRSAPAIAALARDFPIDVVAVYHPKPPRDVMPDQVRAAAKQIGMPGTLAVDRDWAVLERNWPADDRRFTSVSLVLDADGRVRWIHAGGEFHALGDTGHKSCAYDYDQIRRAVEVLCRPRR